MTKSKAPLIPKEPVKIRHRHLSNGNVSLYLDIYHDGKRSYEFLKMYLIPETSPNARTLNANTLQAAQAIKSKRIIELTNDKAGITTSQNARITLSEYAEAYRERKQRKGQSSIANQVRYLLRYLKLWHLDGVRLCDVDKRLCTRFVDLLRQTDLAQATKGSYFQLLGAMLNEAVRAEFIPSNPMLKLDKDDRIRKVSPEREYLTMNEVAALIATPIRKKATLCEGWEIVKQAFLFSCFCGLRVSDLRALRWENIHQRDGYKEVRITMQKTRQELILPLSNEALKWLPERPKYAIDTSHIFGRLDDYANAVLKEWAELAGIKKRVSFHTARHTFATMMLTLGADLYTVSKLLGHSDIQITQVYAKVIDTRKIEAVSLLDGRFEHLNDE